MIISNSAEFTSACCHHVVDRFGKLSSLLLLPYALFLSSAFAAEPLSQATDCTKIEVQAEINPELSRDENLQKLSEMFYQSLNTVTHCDSASESMAESQSTNGIAASDLSGTESEESMSESNADSDQQSYERDVEDNFENTVEMAEFENDEAGDEQAGTEQQNGTKAPDDIPPADNDSVFEKQIRQAAENETDPELRERLWNEYRKYKGLPVKPVKEKT